MSSDEQIPEINSRKSSFTGSISSRGSSFMNVEDDKTSIASHDEGSDLLIDTLDIAPGDNSLQVELESTQNNLSEEETVVDSDEDDEISLQTGGANLSEKLYNSLQNVFKKQNPKSGLFDVVFLVDKKVLFFHFPKNGDKSYIHKVIYVHQLILRLRGATKLLKYIKRNGSDEKIQNVNMNIGGDNPITFEELFIFTKSLYFNNVGSDLTPSNVMSILSLANLFDIRSLIINCHIYLTGPKWEDDALTLLEKANNFLDDEIASRCLKVISKKTEMYLSSPKFLKIKHATLMKLLEKRIFNIDAKILFDKVYEWAAIRLECFNKGDTEGCGIRAISGEALNLIPFDEMTQDQFFEVCDKGILTDKEGMDFVRLIWAKSKSAAAAAKAPEFNEHGESGVNKTADEKTEIQTNGISESQTSKLYFSVFPTLSYSLPMTSDNSTDDRPIGRNSNVPFEGSPYRPHINFADNADQI